ncbi:5'-nucleotidase C-terminal domain-containing protein, partial [bacterium]|nr:5'-nucleotidase C-terminal domain-containing protein [bacterium]
LSHDGIESFRWSLIPVDDEVEEDERVASFLDKFRVIDEEVLGVIDADLDLAKSSIRMRQSTIGTLVCEAIAEEFPTASMVMVNSGGIRGNFQPAGPITLSEVDAILPFHNEMVLLWLSGKELKSALERSVVSLPKPDSRFLQVLGLQVEVDLSQPAMEPGRGEAEQPGQRVGRVLVRGAPLQMNREYLVATMDYLARGGDGYIELARGRRHVKTGKVLNNIFADYIRRHSPIRPRRESSYIISE